MYIVHILLAHSPDLYGGKVSQIFYLGISFYFMLKIGKDLKKIVNIIFETT